MSHLRMASPPLSYSIVHLLHLRPVVPLLLPEILTDTNHLSDPDSHTVPPKYNQTASYHTYHASSTTRRLAHPIEEPYCVCEESNAGCQQHQIKPSTTSHASPSLTSRFPRTFLPRQDASRPAARSTRTPRSAGIALAARLHTADTAGCFPLRRGGIARTALGAERPLRAADLAHPLAGLPLGPSTGVPTSRRLRFPRNTMSRGEEGRNRGQHATAGEQRGGRSRERSGSR